MKGFADLTLHDGRRTGSSVASASGPRSMIMPNKVAVSRSVAVRMENNTAATVAVPKAAPTERENCTMAAPVPRRRGPDTDCTVTWTTPMTVPMNKATPTERPGELGGAEIGDEEREQQQA